MTVTVASITARALRLLQVLDANESPTAEDSAIARGVLNQIGQRYAANSLIQSWTDVSGPDGEIEDTYGLYAPELAIRLAPEYGLEPPATATQLAAQARADLWRDRLASAGTGTWADIIYRALRALSGKGVAVFPDAFALPAALYALDTLGSRWAQSGLIESWTTPAAYSDTYSGGQAAADAFTYNLALRLAAEYGVDIREEVAELAQAGIISLWRDRLVSDGAINTAGALLYRSLRILCSKGATLPDNYSLSGALATLQLFLAELRGSDIMVTDYAVSATSDALSVDPADMEALSYQMALRLAPEYGMSLSQEAAAAARESWTRFMHRYFQAGRSDFGELPMDAGRWSWSGLH